MTITGPFYRCTDPTDQVARWNIQRNRKDLELWRTVVPDDEGDVDTVVSNLTTRSGLSKGVVLSWIMIVKLLEDYPLLSEHNDALGLLDYPRLRAIETGLMAVSDAKIIKEVDQRLTVYLTPKKPSQELPGRKAISRFIRNLLSELDPPAAELESDPRGHGINFSASGRGEMNINISLPEDQGREVRETLSAMRNRNPDATLLDSFMELVRGTVPPKVVHNVYGPADAPPTYLAGGGWLDDSQATEWAERVTAVRDMDVAEKQVTDSYRPSEAIARAVRGRDGTCRFPEDCDVDAEDCDIDHVVNHADGGETKVSNLHCLCRRHHNVKTGRRITVSMDEDGVDTWTYDDGTTVVTYPQGPLATQNKIFGQTFAQRRSKRAEERRRRNRPPEPPKKEGMSEDAPF